MAETLTKTISLPQVDSKRSAVDTIQEEGAHQTLDLLAP